MNLNQVTLPSTDVARGAAFYRRLGFHQIVEDLPEYARFECPVGSATFSLHRVDRVAAADNGVVVYFECDDLDATVVRLERDGIAIDHAPRDQPWLWREAYLRDPDGNTICLFHAGVIRHYPPWRLTSADDAARAVAVHGASSLTIAVEDEPDPLDVNALGAGLREHSLGAIDTPGFHPLAVFARDGAGTIVGGIFALHNWNWLQINYVWVAEPLRGTGLGHRLLDTIEETARARGCTRAHLDTFSFQARPFYERHGYEVFGTLDDYPPGERRFYLRKMLTPPSR